MSARVCLPVFLSDLRTWVRQRLWCTLAVFSAVVLTACAPLGSSTQGAITTGESTEDGGGSVSLAKLAPPIPHHKDPLSSLKAELLEDMPEVDQQGLASWYGPGFHGRKTANGERFNQYELTAAHPTYKFGTQLCVRSKLTGQAVVVRVNDRGPYVKGRVIDLSKAAAEEIGLLDKGVKAVEIYKLNDDEEECPAAIQQASYGRED